MKIMVTLRPTIVAQLRTTSPSDMEMHFVTIQVAIHPIHRIGGQVIAKYGTVSLLGGQNVGQSQWLRL